jgi:hypothetical protein
MDKRLRIAIIVLIVSTLLAIIFQIVQGTKHGCWTGDDTTNFSLDNGHVMCCNGISLISCAVDAPQCLQSGTGPNCSLQLCISCIFCGV